MKKLMIALAAVAMAAGVQAANYNWQIDPMDSMWGFDGSTVDGYTGTGYLFTDGMQQTVLDSFLAGDALSGISGMLASNAIVDGNTPQLSAQFTDENKSYTAFFAAVLTEAGKDYLYISDIGSANGPDTGAGTIKIGPGDSSWTVPMESDSYSTAGWYTMAVPEPTSGLLLLLGVAGLALRRRRA